MSRAALVPSPRRRSSAWYSFTLFRSLAKIEFRCRNSVYFALFVGEHYSQEVLCHRGAAQAEHLRGCHDPSIALPRCSVCNVLLWSHMPIFSLRQNPDCLFFTCIWLALCSGWYVKPQSECHLINPNEHFSSTHSRTSLRRTLLFFYSTTGSLWIHFSQKLSFLRGCFEVYCQRNTAPADNNLLFL